MPTRLCSVPPEKLIEDPLVEPATPDYGNQVVVRLVAGRKVLYPDELRACFLDVPFALIELLKPLRAVRGVFSIQFRT